MIDLVILIVLLVAAVFGFMKGIIRQVAAMVGLVAAFLFSIPLGVLLGPLLSNGFNLSPFLAEKLGMFLAGVLIYLAFSLSGFFLQKLFINRIKPLRSVNHFGGAALGSLKVLCIIMVLFCFISLLPQSILGSVPFLTQSKFFQFADRHNPFEKERRPVGVTAKGVNGKNRAFFQRGKSVFPPQTKETTEEPRLEADAVGDLIEGLEQAKH